MSDEMQPVAWMYEHKADASEMFMQPNRANMDPRYWTENPLYTFEQLQGFNRVVDHPATSTPVVSHEPAETSDNDLIEQVARWMCDQSPYSADDWRDYVEDAMSLLRAIDLPAQREAAARAALEAAATVAPSKTPSGECETVGQWTRRTLREAIRAIDPAAFRGDDDE